jgi:hypothetical protein
VVSQGCDLRCDLSECFVDKLVLIETQVRNVGCDGSEVQPQ